MRVVPTEVHESVLIYNAKYWDFFCRKIKQIARRSSSLTVTRSVVLSCAASAVRLAFVLLRSFVCGKALQRTARDGQPTPISCAIQRVRDEPLHVGGRARSLGGVPLLLLELPLPVLVKRIPSLRSRARALAAVARAARSSVAIGLVRNHRDDFALHARAADTRRFPI